MSNVHNIAVVIDPLDSLSLKKDSSLAIMQAFQAQGHHVVVIETRDLMLHNGRALARGQKVTLDLNKRRFYEVLEHETYDLESFDLILMRKDPPFDAEYIAATHILEVAGTRVVNDPVSLRIFNEKASLGLFPELTPPTLMTRSCDALVDFLDTHGKVVLKPLNQMGGRGIFVLQKDDPNQNVILETVTQDETRTVMCQTYLPEIQDGDQRILIFNGQPVPMMLVRMPSTRDFRGNLAQGATSHVAPLRAAQVDICQKLAPFLQKHKLDIVGLDMIGDFVTEINVTSPTCFREITQMTDLDVASLCLDALGYPPK